MRALMRHTQTSSAAAVLLRKVKENEADVMKTLGSALVALDQLGKERWRLQVVACVDCNTRRKQVPVDGYKQCSMCSARFCNACYGDLEKCSSCRTARCDD